MVAISLMLPAELATTTERYANARGLTRAEYIRQAIQWMNRETKREVLDRRLADASLGVRKESMLINAEFAAIECDLIAE
jgi:hypothetical protein